MPEGFTDLFARRLDAICNINVKEAAELVADVVVEGAHVAVDAAKHLCCKGKNDREEERE